MTPSDNIPKKKSLMGNKAFSSFFGALLAVVIMVLLILVYNISSQMEDLEKKLAYRPPTTQGSAIPAAAVISGQIVYVPIYSHIYAQGGKPHLPEATLSIRNTDPQNAITINSVRYYDTQGNPIQKYLKTPLQIKPLATAEFLVEQKKVEGGSGANFIVEWVSDTNVNLPIIEAVMVGSVGQASISFARPGVAIQN